MKIKNLFAVAALLMASANAFATHTLTEGDEQTIDGIRYKVLTVYNTPSNTKVNTVKASLNGLTGTTITIPDEITFHVKGTDDETTPVAIDKEVTFKVTEVGSFANLSTATTISVSVNVTSIDAGAFAGTSIADLDLSNTKVTTLNALFGTNNTSLKSIKLPASLTTVAASALATCTELNSVTFATIPNGGALTISANAFNVTPSLTELTLPKQVNNKNEVVASNITLAANALAGSSIATLTFAEKTAATIDAIAAPKLTTVTFEGEFSGSIKANAFIGSPKLATVNFNDKITKAGAIESGSFGDDTHFAGEENTPDANGVYVTINYMKTDDTKAAFADDAFGAGSATPDKYKANVFKLITSTSYNLAQLTTHNPAWNAAIYNLMVVAAEATEKLVVASNGSTSYYYAKLFDATKAWKIEKKQGDATVIVYGAYVDDSDATIYMENLHIIEGYYWIPAGTPVVVKSSSSEDVTLTADDGSTFDSTLELGGDPSNRILTAYNSTAGHTDVVGQVLKESTTDYDIDAGTLTFNNTKKDLYFLAPFADYGFLWSKFKDSRVLAAKAAPTKDATTKKLTYEGDFYIRAEKLNAAARLNVVWLDGSEDNTTAIQTVKQNVEDGTIYNLAGQKVDANFKGVVIKNGKKMIQK